MSWNTEKFPNSGIPQDGTVELGAVSLDALWNKRLTLKRTPRFSGLPLAQVDMVPPPQPQTQGLPESRDRASGWEGGASSQEQFCPLQSHEPALLGFAFARDPSLLFFFFFFFSWLSLRMKCLILSQLWYFGSRSLSGFTGPRVEKNSALWWTALHLEFHPRLIPMIDEVLDEGLCLNGLRCSWLMRWVNVFCVWEEQTAGSRGQNTEGWTVCLLPSMKKPYLEMSRCLDKSQRGNYIWNKSKGLILSVTKSSMVCVFRRGRLGCVCSQESLGPDTVRKRALVREVGEEPAWEPRCPWAAGLKAREVWLPVLGAHWPVGCTVAAWAAWHRSPGCLQVWSDDTFVFQLPQLTLIQGFRW